MSVLCVREGERERAGEGARQCACESERASPGVKPRSPDSLPLYACSYDGGEWSSSSCGGSCACACGRDMSPSNSHLDEAGLECDTADAALAALREELARYQGLLDDKTHEHDTLAAAHERSQVGVAHAFTSPVLVAGKKAIEIAVLTACQ